MSVNVKSTGIDPLVEMVLRSIASRRSSSNAASICWSLLGNDMGNDLNRASVVTLIFLEFDSGHDEGLPVFLPFLS